jgi:ribosomal protein S18 acetylase RimI-like enzyme
MTCTGFVVGKLTAPVGRVDLVQLVRLDAQIRDEIGSAFSEEPWLEAQFGLELPEKWRLSRVARSATVGIVGYWIASLPNLGVVHTHRVGVLAACRRMGVATALFREVIAEARSVEAFKMTLQVSTEDEGALAFYAGLGFEPTPQSAAVSLHESKTGAAHQRFPRNKMRDDAQSRTVLSKRIKEAR